MEQQPYFFRPLRITKTQLHDHTNYSVSVPAMHMMHRVMVQREWKSQVPRHLVAHVVGEWLPQNWVA